MSGESGDMELYVWAGEEQWGVPSMDVESLQMMLYVSMSSAPCTVTPLLTPHRSPTGSLPAFRSGNTLCRSFAAMTECLRKMGYTCDDSLSSRQCADVLAYEHHLLDKLQPALDYLWWSEGPSGQDSVARQWLYRSLGYPWKLWLPQRMQSARLEPFCGMGAREEVLAVVLKNAQECLNSLSERLGEKEHFFGRCASSIDARLVAYLCLLYLVPLPNAALQHHIRGCPNLVTYLQRVLQRVLQRDTRPTPAAPPSPSPPSPKRQLATFTLLAALANFLYAKTTGCWQNASQAVMGALLPEEEMLQ